MWQMFIKAGKVWHMLVKISLKKLANFFFKVGAVQNCVNLVLYSRSLKLLQKRSYDLYLILVDTTENGPDVELWSVKYTCTSYLEPRYGSWVSSSWDQKQPAARCLARKAVISAASRASVVVLLLGLVLLFTWRAAVFFCCVNLGRPSDSRLSGDPATVASAPR